MNNYFSPTRSQDNMQDQRSNQRHRPAGNMSILNTSGQGNVLPGPLSACSDMAMPGADSIDDMVHSGHGIHRRGSVAQQYAGQTDQNPPGRRMSMMDFDNPNNFQNFHYGSIGNNITGGFDGMGDDMGMSSHTTAYGQSALMSLSDPNGFPISPMLDGMMDFSNLNVGQLQEDNGLGFLQSSTMGGPYPPTNLNNVNADFSMDMGVEDGPLGASGANQVPDMGSKHDDSLMAGVDETFGLEDSQAPMTHNGNIDQSSEYPHHLFRPNLRATLPQNEAVMGTFQSPSTIRAISHVGGASVPPSAPMTPATNAPTPGPLAAPSKSTIYSKTGFDMLKALWRVASRPNPMIDIGAVDLSCAFVVCDAYLNDCPIIYVSDNFQNLTGYNRHEILGKNCRFLQAPDGNVEAGKKREFVAGDAVQNLKDAIAKKQEIQQSLINYRKGGKPFLNLLTMIPIPWDGDEIRYFIGFQIDLVERPDAISGVESSGAMQVSYNRSEMDRYVWDAPDPSAWNSESGQTLGIDDVSTLLQSFNPKGAASDWHKQSWHKMLLENADDVIHVLTLKGVFLYLSPACKKVLQYDAHELVGQNISAICHPSDLVSLQRDIKDAPHNGAVNFIFRVMRKDNGYTWFEGYGSLYSEQGKGRKCLIMVGRKRPVTVLRRSELEANGGFSETEMWSKVSTAGMFLFVGGNPMKLIDMDKASLVGTSMQDLMRKDTRMEFGRAMEKARMGHIVSCKHELFNKKGTAIQACTTFYPGDTPTGMKPSFLIAQTRLVRAHSRAIVPAPPRPLGAPGVLVTDEPNQTPRTMPTAVSRATEETGTLVHTPTMPDTTADPHDLALADPDNLFDELRTTRGTSWYYELRHMEKVNRQLSEELAAATNNRKKRKRRKAGNMVRDCANCHTRNTPEWRRGPSGNRDLCNSCGLRWAKSNGRISPRNSARGGNGDTASKKSSSPIHSSPLHREVSSADTYALEQTNKTPASADEEVATPTPGSAGNGTAQPQSIDEVVTGYAHTHGYNPPQSTPMLEGGSGLGGGGMEMTAIREEWETSA